MLPTAIPEVRKRGETARAFVARLALEKAEAARRMLSSRGPYIAAPVLAADTVVVAGRHVLEKPGSAKEAGKMLRLLSGRTHVVMTGICVLYPEKDSSSRRWRKKVRVSSTEVKFRKLTASEIESYVTSGEPFDKAGGYAIQGLASKYIEWIRGCYFNVVGLPISMVYALLKELQKEEKQ